MADSSKLRAASSFASDATLSRGINEYSPSPLSQKPAYPPSYDEKPEHNNATRTSFSTYLRKFKDVCLMLLKKYWFLVGLAFVITIAWAAPNVARKGGYIRAEWSIKWGAVIIIFLISGLSLRTKILTQTFMRVRLHLLVQIINLVIIPFFVFGVVLLFFKLHASMNSLVLIGLVIAASTPTTVSSNVVMTKTAKGNEATALMNAAVGNVLGIFVSPALVDTFQEPLIDATPEHEAAHSGGTVDFIIVLKQLGLTVLLPLVVGQIIQLMFTEQVAKIKVKWRLSDVSSVCLLCMVWSVFCDAFYNESFSAVSATDIVAVAILNAAFYVLFSLLCFFLAYLPFPSSVREPAWLARLRYSREDTVAVMYCGATKTVAMGVPLINVLYQHGDPGTVGVLSTPLLLYHVEQLILGNIEVDILKKWVLSGKEKENDAPPPRDIEDRMPPDNGMASRVPQSSPSDVTPTSPVDTIQVKHYLADTKSDPIKKLPAEHTEHPVNKPDEQDCTKQPQQQQKEYHEQTKHQLEQRNSEESSEHTQQERTSQSSRASRQSFQQQDQQEQKEEREQRHSTEQAPASKGLKIETTSTQESASEREATKEQHNQSPMDDLLNSPLFTSDTATISLDTSRFSLDSVYNPPSPPPPIPTKRYPF